MEFKKIYIYTIGCQMNVYDSEQYYRLLGPVGFERTDVMDNADLIILNTCSIREKAADKAFSFLGRANGIKRKKKGTIIGIAGCVAQQEGHNILKRAAYVDFVLGTHAGPKLVSIIQQVMDGNGPVVATDFSDGIDESVHISPAPEATDASGFVTIMRGCDNYCTYCVVPYVRGRETSREPQHILSEIQALAATGKKEVTLLGQNVNSYGQKEHMPGFASLLRMVHDIDGIERIRFATSHPKDLSDELIGAFRDLPKLCRHVHLPVQSGSNQTLKRMNRKYTREHYLERVQKLKDACPGITFSSDMIVGFPGETDDDFKETLSLVETVGFEGLYAFTYSDRPMAPAAKFDDKIPEKIKKARLHELMTLQDAITRQNNEALVGRHMTILVEGPSKMAGARDNQWTGRADSNKIVNFSLPDDISGDRVAGSIVRVYIQAAHAHSLVGDFVEIVRA